MAVLKMILIKKATAEKIFDLIEKFAGYGFNKSHSAAYAMLSYQTAYLKTYFPEHFMAAVLSTELGNTDKISTLINECKEMKIKVLTPDIKTSIICYKTNKLNYAILSRLVRTPFVGLPNLLLQKHIFPELIQYDLTPESIVSSFSKISSEPENYQSYLSEINDSMQK